MARIDEDFSVGSLNELSNWPERLSQACDEAKLLSPILREAIIKGLSIEDRYIKIDQIEEALNKCKSQVDAGIGMTLFVKSLGQKFAPWLLTPLRPQNPDYPHHPLVNAARDLVFPDAPMKLFDCFFNTTGLLGMFTYLPQLYGEDIFSQDSFFTDVETEPMQPESRLNFILHHCLARDIAVATGISIKGFVKPPETIPFVIAWHHQLAQKSYELASHFRHWLERWLKKDNVMYVTQYVSVYLEEAGPLQLNDAISKTHANLKDVAATLTKQEIALTPRQGVVNFPFDWKRFAPLIPDLGADRLRQLIEWSLDHDIATWRCVKEPYELFSFTTIAKYWYTSPYRQDWLAAIWRRIDDTSLTPADRFAVLRHRIDDIELLPEDIAAYQRSKEELAKIGIVPAYTIDDTEFWSHRVSDDIRIPWIQRFESLIDTPGFPVELRDQWVQAAINRSSDPKKIANEASKSLGLMRKLLASEEEKFQLKEYRNAVDYLKLHDPRKLLRLLLLAFRSSLTPSCGPDLAQPESGNFINSYYDEGFTPSQSLIVLILEMLSSRNSQQLELMTGLAEFSVSRLCLHKGEKVSNGNYTNAQCVEPSEIWRQAYLKALLEIGLDLGGKVHKTVFFVRNHDPDADVRKVAKEVYKAVRRSDTKLNSTSIARACLAAMWWLRLAQRQSMNLEINPDAARRTRRRELRNIR